MIYLNTAIDSDDIVALKHVDISCPDIILPELHPHVSPISDTRIEFLQAAHRIPTVIDKDLVLGVSVITGVHNEA